MKKWQIKAWLSAAVLGAAAAHAMAQDFPSRPVTLVAPYPAGSATDNVARPLAMALQGILGQPVIVDNRAGAQGMIGADYVARSKPDGYTLLVASSTMFAGASLVKNLPYDPMAAFQLVSGIGSTSMMFMVKADSPVKSVEDLIRSGKNQNAPLAIGFGAASAQVALAMFTSASGITVIPVPYKGTPQALTDLAGGQIPVAVVDIGNGVAQMKAGRLRPLAISAKARSAAAADVPLLSETLKGAALETLIAVVAPAGTPPAVVERLDKAIRLALTRPAVKAAFATTTTEVLPLATAELTQILKADTPKWHALIKAAGIEPQ